MRNQYYEPLPFDEQQFAGGEMSQFDKVQGERRQMNQGMMPTEWDESQGINDKMQLSDQQNIKCSIEIKNGIPQRSLNNFHKN